jgi:hypothetical protein
MAWVRGHWGNIHTASGEPDPRCAYVTLSEGEADRRYGAPRTKPTTQMTLSTRICACDFPKSSRACAARTNVSASVSLMIHCRPFFCHCAPGQISRRRLTSIGFHANRTDATSLPLHVSPVSESYSVRESRRNPFLANPTRCDVNAPCRSLLQGFVARQPVPSHGHRPCPCPVQFDAAAELSCRRVSRLRR